jgi:GMP synthase (glutamine-hydrolysing)
MKILIIDNGTRHLRKLKELLCANDLDISPLFKKYPPTKDCDLIILSGGSQLSVVNAPEVFKEEINMIKTSKIPIIGICEGCEIIAYAFGSQLELRDKKSKGLKRIVLLDDKFITKHLEELEVYENHYWSITKLGKNLIGLAKSRYGYEIIKHKTKPVYGLQFHPEMCVDTASGDEIFNQILNHVL